MIELDALEARILGCLIEKEATVANSYPLTLNSLKLACNQKSARNPVMNVADGELKHCAHQLGEKNYILIEDNFGKIEKYRHRFGRILEIDNPKLAIIAILLLRGEQTTNEIYTKSKRIFAFENHQQSYDELLVLIENNLVIKLPKKSGTKEYRYMHQLCGKIDVNEIQKSKPKLTPLEEKVAKLENRVDELQDLIDDILEKI